MTTKSVAEEPSERNLLLDVLTYPFRGGGWLMLLIGAGMSILLKIASIAPLIGMIAGLFSAGFFASYYLDIINNTVNDKDDPPEWPDISNFGEDIGRPLLQTLGVALISLVPYALTFLLDATDPARETWQWAARALFILYFPMSMLGVVMHGHLGGALPHRVIPAIFRALPGYLLVVALFAGLTVLSSLSDAIGSTIPFLGFVITAIPTLYLLMAEARLIGLLYRAKREQIGWG
jgi:hypothetical protein